MRFLLTPTKKLNCWLYYWMNLGKSSSFEIYEWQGFLNSCFASFVSLGEPLTRIGHAFLQIHEFEIRRQDLTQLFVGRGLPENTVALRGVRANLTFKVETFRDPFAGFEDGLLAVVVAAENHARGQTFRFLLVRQFLFWFEEQMTHSYESQQQISYLNLC